MCVCVCVCARVCVCVCGQVCVRATCSLPVLIGTFCIEAVYTFVNCCHSWKRQIRKLLSEFMIKLCLNIYIC